MCYVGSGLCDVLTILSEESYRARAVGLLCVCVRACVYARVCARARMCVCVCNWDVRIYRTKQNRNEGTKIIKGGLLINRSKGKK